MKEAKLIKQTNNQIQKNKKLSKIKYFFLTKHDQTPISRQNEIRNCILQILNSERNANRDPVSET